MVDAAALSDTKNSATGTTGSAKKNLSANYDMFLRLLTAQIKNQNPMDPMDSTKFTEQLATFSSLEQQIATNDKLDSVLSQFSSMTISNAAGHIGKTITAVGNTIAVDAAGKSDAQLAYSVGSDAKEVKLSVTDSKGNVVWSGTGDAAPGNHEFTWDGKDSKGKTVPAGDYTLKVAATDADGKAVGTATTISGKVTAVLSGQGMTLLEIGGTKVNLNAVTRMTA